MIVYDDLAPLEKIRVFDMRVERPPHYDTFGEFQYAYHYGDMYAPYIKQEEPLKTECQHFIDCIKYGATPVSCGTRGTELVSILEASSESLRKGGSPVHFGKPQNGRTPAMVSNGVSNGIPIKISAPALAAGGTRAKRVAGGTNTRPTLVLNGH
jgi:hypothetical protein